MLLVKYIYLLKFCVSVLLLAFELLCLQISFIINIGLLVIKLQLSSYKFLGSFYETKLKTALIDSTVFYLTVRIASFRGCILKLLIFIIAF